MEKIMIIGSCGAGKSTMSRKLHSITGIPLFHLDQYFWNPGWREPEKKEWRRIVKSLAEKPTWILDGNYGGTIDIRLEKADTIIYLDCPTWKSLWRVISRSIKNWQKVRPDMSAGCKERFDFKFLHYVATFNLTRRKNLLEKLDSKYKEKTVWVFKNDQQVANFLLKMDKVFTERKATNEEI